VDILGNNSQHGTNSCACHERILVPRVCMNSSFISQNFNMLAISRDLLDANLETTPTMDQD
jgi:hypothetical protein